MIFIDKLFPYRVKDKMASSITKKAILFDFSFPMYKSICTIFTKHSQYTSHSVQKHFLITSFYKTCFSESKFTKQIHKANSQMPHFFHFSSYSTMS